MIEETNIAIPAYDLSAIASALRITKRSAERRSVKEEWPFESRAQRGGAKRFYPTATLPPEIQTALILSGEAAEEPEAQKHARKNRKASQAAVQSAWEQYDRSPDHIKETAQQRLRALQAVARLVGNGCPVMQARDTVVAQLRREGVRGASRVSLWRWEQRVASVEPQHCLAFLMPEYSHFGVRADIPVEAWDLFKADYLRVEAPTASSCYERLQRIAQVRQWTLPSLKTFQRRIVEEISPPVLTLARRGRERLMQMYPAQERDRSVFHALEAVNADGHKFDVFVRWEDGSIGRPIMVGVQDLYSGKLLGNRLGPTETAELARLAFRDVFEVYGIPSKVWLDNGRGFASKLLTGGMANRFRFKVREDDPVGVLTALGCQVHWAMPYHGQAKPIERAWRDLCDRIAKHPALAGAYTGNKPDAKPENYGSTAVPIAEFIRVVNEEITAHNARPGRRSHTTAGNSFDATFNASYATSPIRKATNEQLRQLLLSTSVVSCHRRTGEVHLAGNRYWSEAIAPYAGKKVMLRFDPENLHQTVQVYSLADAYIGMAECIKAQGFNDTAAAKEHSRAVRGFNNATKKQLEAQRRLDAAAVAAQLPAPAPDALPPAGVVAPFFKRSSTEPEAPFEQQRTGTDDHHDVFTRYINEIHETQKRNHLWVVPTEDTE